MKTTFGCGEKMNDYEINLRLAEIVGFDWAELDGRFQYARLDHPEFGSMWGHEWSPLTDWGQLGPLQERFDVATKRIRGATPRHDGKWSAIIGPDNNCEIVVDPDLKRAIALAIIGAHENGG
jgi:hypothetical protein